MSLVDFRTEVAGKYPDEEIRAAWEQALAKTNGVEDEKTMKKAMIALRAMQNSSKISCFFTAKAPTVFSRRGMYETAKVAVLDNKDEALKNKLAIVYEKNEGEANWSEYRPIASGVEKSIVDSLPEKVEMLKEGALACIPLDTREKFGDRVNSSYLQPLTIGHAKIFIGVASHNGTTMPAYLRVNDHIPGDIDAFEIPLNTAVGIMNAVPEVVGGVLRINSTKEISFTEAESFIEPFQVDQVLGEKSILNLTIGEYSVVKGAVINATIRKPSDSKSHVVSLAGDSFEDADQITAFIKNEIDLSVEQADDVIVFGTKVTTKDGGTIFAADIIAKLD